MGNSISNEECDAKIKAEENGKQSFINKFHNTKIIYLIF